MQATVKIKEEEMVNAKASLQWAAWPVQGTEREPERAEPSSLSEEWEVRLESDRFMEGFIGQGADLVFVFKQGNDMFSFRKVILASGCYIDRKESGRQVRRLMPQHREKILLVWNMS